VLVVAVLLVAALLGAGGGDSPRPATVVVQSDSDARILPLDAAGRLEARGPLGISIVEVEAGRARVLASPCAQQICVRRGWLDGAGDIAACVPNRLVVRLEGPAGADFDGVSH
jgi:hypothetical protein